MGQGLGVKVQVAQAIFASQLYNGSTRVGPVD